MFNKVFIYSFLSGFIRSKTAKQMTDKKMK